LLNFPFRTSGAFSKGTSQSSAVRSKLCGWSFCFGFSLELIPAVHEGLFERPQLETYETYETWEKSRWTMQNLRSWSRPGKSLQLPLVANALCQILRKLHWSTLPHPRGLPWLSWTA
jgi:hypothetical protein